MLQDELAKVLWDYHLLHQDIGNAECIVGLGCSVLRVAEKSAALYLDGHAPYLLFSGGLGRTSSKLWTKPEADMFKDRALELGVPIDKIIIENRSTNIWENFQFIWKVLEEKNLNFQKYIFVVRPFFEKRLYVNLLKRWPGIEFSIASPKLDYEEYIKGYVGLDRDEIINLIVGEVHRIEVFPRLGYTVPIEIPDNVYKAFRELVKMGYSKYLVKE